MVSPTPTSPPVVAGDLPLTTVDFSCRLPVSKFSGGGDYASYSDGFIAFPTATFSTDPNGGVHSRNAQQAFATDAAPALSKNPKKFRELLLSQAGLRDLPVAYIIDIDRQVLFSSV